MCDSGSIIQSCTGWQHNVTANSYWAFAKDGIEGHEGLHVLEDGDWLRVFNWDGSVRWEGDIQLKSYSCCDFLG
jgi:hypothetical protein